MAIPVDAPAIKSRTTGHIMDACKPITTLKYIHGIKKSNWLT